MQYQKDYGIFLCYVGRCPPAPQPRTNCGIHSIVKNQNGSILATGGENPNNIAAYRLPSMEPICVGEVRISILFSSVLPKVMMTGHQLD